MFSMGRRLALAVPVALIALIAQGTLAFADDPWVNAPAGTLAKEIAPIYWIMFFFAVVVLAIVDGGLIFAAIRFRERPGGVAQQIHGHNFLELTWTVIPTLMVIGFSVVSFQRLQLLNDTTSNVDMTITAHAAQWSWTFEYPHEDRFKLSDGTFLQRGEELHVRAGQKIRVILEAKDVIHSFWVPQIGGKKDAVPGRPTELWIQADQPGVYKGQCLEFCGDGHADMLITLFAHDEADYAKWAQAAVAEANLLNDPATKAGKDLIEQKACVGCHTVKGTKAAAKVGPELSNFANPQINKDGIAGTLPVTLENTIRWITDPKAVKPSTQMPKVDLTPDEIDALAKFLMTRK